MKRYKITFGFTDLRGWTDSITVDYPAPPTMEEAKEDVELSLDKFNKETGSNRILSKVHKVEFSPMIVKVVCRNCMTTHFRDALESIEDVHALKEMIRDETCEGYKIDEENLTKYPPFIGMDYDEAEREFWDMEYGERIDLIEEYGEPCNDSTLLLEINDHPL